MMSGVHPAAEVFPLLPADQLRELVADIRANGLREPLTLDREGLLLDGRNRLAAQAHGASRDRSPCKCEGRARARPSCGRRLAAPVVIY